MTERIERRSLGHRATWAWRVACALSLLVALGTAEAAPASRAPTNSEVDSRTVTLVVRDTELREVLEMLSRNEGLNVAISDQIQARVSVSLFDVSLDEAVRALAQAAGLAVDLRKGTYVLVDFEELGLDTASGATEVRAYKIDYSDPEQVREILEKHLSRYGEITALIDRRMIVVEDTPEFLARIEEILEEVDQQPKQILLEAKVLEVSLDDTESFGVDWSRVAEVAGSDITVGLRGLTSGTAPGLFFNLMNENLEGAVEALSIEGRVRALASPRLLTMENQEAEVLVGERQGYRVTTTINQVTTESIEFLESGVILRFTPSVDRNGRVLLQIHPEVSTQNIRNEIPNLLTTEVTTQLLADDGDEIFIGGLIRDSATESRTGVPLLSRIPVLGRLFSKSDWENTSTETIVIVRATVRNPDRARTIDGQMIERIRQVEPGLDRRRLEMENDLDLVPWEPAIEPLDRIDPYSAALEERKMDPVLERFDGPASAGTSAEPIP